MANTTNFGWETPDDTDLVKDGALAMRTLGNAIDTSLVDLKGGTTGQVLSKNTNADMDFTWITQNDADAIQNSIVDAKGDLISATADNTPARLASSGVNGQVLTVDTSTSTGLKWATPAAGGKVLQVVEGSTTTLVQTTSASFVDSNLTATITPTSATSKILVLVSQNGVGRYGGQTGEWQIRLLRGATDIGNNGDWGLKGADTESQIRGFYYSLSVLDSPNTTSATTYKTQIKNTVSGFGAEAQGYDSTQTCRSSIILMEIGA